MLAAIAVGLTLVMGNYRDADGNELVLLKEEIHAEEVVAAEEPVAEVSGSIEADLCESPAGQSGAAGKSETESLDPAQKSANDQEKSGSDGSVRLWGTCTITFYCPCSRCCGTWAGGATASGTVPEAGRTVAADLPFGTRLMIEGHEYVVEDRGVGGMWVDIFVDSHTEALQRGMYQAEVYIIE